MTTSICDLSHIQALSRAESCEINDSLAFEMVKIEHKLAQKCKLETLDKNKTATIPLIGEFQLNNHRASIKDVALDKVPEKQIPKPFLWGEVKVEEFVKELRLREVTEVKVEKYVSTKGNKNERMVTIGESL